MNYFASPSAAERYRKGRPYFHPLVAARIAAACEGEIREALDVGCGTGQSTHAIAGIASRVIGTDLSPAMLVRAERRPRVEFIEAPAESLPFPPQAFDLVAAGLAFHWFDRAAFLKEAHRVLRPHRWLAIYNDGFQGRMEGNDHFAVWNREHYLKRFPSPSRSSPFLPDGEAERHGFLRLAHETFSHSVAFTREELVSYLLTQSNIIAAIEERGEAVEEIAGWLIASLAPYFAAEPALFPFRCVLDIFERDAS